MRTLKKQLQLKEKIDKIFCNKCGVEIKKDSNNYYDCLEINKTWGYFSNYDGETHTFDICQSCYDEFIKSFTIPADKFNI